ncbi:MAG: hypothetical protein R3B06_27685 [Kofleriaceae bacterium]
MRSPAVALLVLTAGCLGPLVDDAPGSTSQVLPPGAVLPRVEDDPVLTAQVVANDGVDGTVPLWRGFADGAPIQYWDLGPSPTFAAPVFVLMRRTPSGLERVAHNTLVDTLPGDAAYTPYWSVYVVVVTDRYQGEIIPSVAALDDALTQGLIEAPAAQPVAVNCPIVGPGVALEAGAGQPPLPPTARFNVRGRTVAYFDLGMLPLTPGGGVPEVARYRLRREGGEPLSEPVRRVDMTGDGDVVDSNDVLAYRATDPMPSPLCRTIDVVVPATTGSIDTSGDDTQADLRAAEQLFAPGPVVGTVVSFQPTDAWHDCVVQQTPGGR